MSSRRSVTPATEEPAEQPRGRMPKVTPNRMERRMPVRTSKFKLDGQYAGWEMEARTNPPLGMWMDLMQIITSAEDSDDSKDFLQGMAAMYEALKVCIISWNFVDEEGAPLPADMDGIKRLPLDLLSLCFGILEKAVEDTPLVGSKS